MADYGMKRNGSGYYDPTAYAAMIGMAKPGEIWETNNGKKLVLILKNHDHGNFCNCLTLTDKVEDKYCMEVRGKYTNPGMVQYLYNDYLSSWVTTLTPAEFENVRCAVSNALGLRGREPEPEPVEMTLAQKCHALLDMILEGGK